MQKDDFLKEKQDIREKMLRYSRAIKEGKPYEELNDINTNDDILKKRLQSHKKPNFIDFEKEIPTSGNIYLKEDLINVKLEEKKPFNFKFVFNFKSKKKQNELPIKAKKQNITKKAKIKPAILNKNKEEKKKNFKLKNLKEFNSHTRLFIQNKKQDSSQEKELLLEGHTQAIQEEKKKNLSLFHFALAYGIILFALIVFVPQIFIRNEIYYLSREISTLRAQEAVLNEENKELSRNLENMRFRNQILDYLE